MQDFLFGSAKNVGAKYLDEALFALLSYLRNMQGEEGFEMHSSKLAQLVANARSEYLGTGIHSVHLEQFFSERMTSCALQRCMHTTLRTTVCNDSALCILCIGDSRDLPSSTSTDKLWLTVAPFFRSGLLVAISRNGPRFEPGTCTERNVQAPCVVLERVHRIISSCQGPRT